MNKVEMEAKKIIRKAREVINKEGFIWEDKFLKCSPNIITDGGKISAIIYNLNPEEWVEVLISECCITITALAEYDGCRYVLDSIEVEL